jgi:hypothetical protein
MKLPEKRHRCRLGLVGCSAALLLLTATCAVPPAPVYERNGERYGETAGLFRQQWWSYYERGTSYARGDYRGEAAHDFTAALALRDDDYRQARTYGMHYVDYFPNRELGIVRLADGRYEEAVTLLEHSLSHVASQRARYFLDRARQLRLLQTGEDTQPPTLSIDTPLAGLITRELSVAITGHAADDTFVAAVNIGGQPFPIALSEPLVRFQMAVELREGENHVAVRATDLVGHATEASVSVVADFHGPEVTIIEVVAERDGLRVAGWVYDLSGVVNLTVGGHPVALHGDEFTTHIGDPGSSGALEVVATDRAGNTTRGKVTVPGMEARSMSSILWAAGADRPLRAPRATDLAPRLDLYGWDEIDTITADRIYLQGSAIDDHAVTALFLNGEPLLQHPGRQVMFGKVVPLTPGDNLLVLRAVDDAGHVLERRLTITRRPAPGHDIGDRLRLTCLPLHAADQSTGVVALATDTALYTVLADRRRFQLVERSALEAVLCEHHLSAAGLADRRTPSHLGRLLGSDVVAAGALVPFHEGFEATVWLVNAATSHLLGIADGFMPARDLTASRGLAEKLAVAMEQTLPLVEGEVIDRDAAAIVTDLGETTRVKPEMGLWVFEPGPQLHHPTTGVPLGRDGHVIAEAVIDQVRPTTSRAVLVDPARRSEIHAGQRAITK